jgi:hypothetical protein
MKAMAVNCLRFLIIDKFGREVYSEICKKLNLIDKQYLNSEEIEDAKVSALVDELANRLNISRQELFDYFGEYFHRVFAQKYFRSFFNNCNNAYDFLKTINRIHVKAGKILGCESPPRFVIVEDEHRLIIHYISKRNYIDLIISNIKGVAKFYNENVIVNKLDDKTVEVMFED